VYKVEKTKKRKGQRVKEVEERRRKKKLYSFWLFVSNSDHVMREMEESETNPHEAKFKQRVMAPIVL
jgi:hypothetical protein